MVKAKDLDDMKVKNEKKKYNTEMRKPRPAVVISNDIANASSPNVIVAFVSSSPNKLKKEAEKPSPVHIPVTLKRDSLILCENIDSISKERLLFKVGELDSQQTILLNQGLMYSLGLSWIS